MTGYNTCPVPHLEELLDVRCLYTRDEALILKNTPRKLSRCTRLVRELKALAQQSALDCSEGMLLSLPTKRIFFHMVSVYRCLDGQYLYYNSFQQTVHPAFLEYLNKKGVSCLDLTVLDASFQDRRLGTCAYHALTFMDIVTSAGINDSDLLINHFKEKMGGTESGL